MNLLRELSLQYASVKLFDTNVVRVEITGVSPIGFDEAREINDAIGTLTSGRKCLVLIVADTIARFKKEGLAFSAGEEGQRYTIADGLVVKSIRQRFLANFYLMIFRPKKPTRMFNSEAAALKWLYATEENVVPG